VIFFESKLGVKAKTGRVMEPGRRRASCSKNGVFNFQWKYTALLP